MNPVLPERYFRPSCLSIIFIDLEGPAAPRSTLKGRPFDLAHSTPGLCRVQFNHEEHFAVQNERIFERVYDGVLGG